MVFRRCIPHSTAEKIREAGIRQTRPEDKICFYLQILYEQEKGMGGDQTNTQKKRLPEQESKDTPQDSA